MEYKQEIVDRLWNEYAEKVRMQPQKFEPTDPVEAMMRKTLSTFEYYLRQGVKYVADHYEEEERKSGLV